MYEIEEKKDIKNMIYIIRGKQVMLDSDVAHLFGYETKDLNRNVKNNIERFPKEYCFRLTKEEYELLRWKNFTSKKETRGGRQYMPFAFTEYGITMLAGLLKSPIAIKTSIKIVNQFIEMKKILKKDDSLALINDIYNIKNTLIEHGDKIDTLFDKFNRKEDLKNKLFFNGEIYDSYSLLVDIINKANNEIIIVDNYVNKANNEIIIVDNYVNKETLDILSKKKINVTILLVTDKSKNNLTKTDIKKFNNEYPSLNIKYTNIFHDRFIILDKKELYHLGSSLKDLGNKVFGINKINDYDYVNELINKIKTLANN